VFFGGWLPPQSVEGFFFRVGPLMGPPWFPRGFKGGVYRGVFSLILGGPTGAFLNGGGFLKGFPILYFRCAFKSPIWIFLETHGPIIPQPPVNKFLEGISP